MCSVNLVKFRLTVHSALCYIFILHLYCIYLNCVFVLRSWLERKGGAGPPSGTQEWINGWFTWCMSNTVSQTGVYTHSEREKNFWFKFFIFLFYLHDNFGKIFGSLSSRKDSSLSLIHKMSTSWVRGESPPPRRRSATLVELLQCIQHNCDINFKPSLWGHH